VTSGAFRPLVRKEARALMPVWAASAAVIVVAAQTGSPLLFRVGVLAYAFGSVTIGALSIGHEYASGTLAGLLTQPIGRGRLLVVKMAVMSTLVFALMAIALGLLSPKDAGGLTQRLVLAVGAGSILIAPIMTMLARGALPGTVFTIGVCGLVAAAADVLANGPSTRITDENAVAARTLFNAGMAVLCAAAAVVLWPLFRRLEAIDGRGTAIELPGWARVRSPSSPDALTSRPQHPFGALFAKELRLQQIPFLVTALYVMVASTAAFLQWRNPDADYVPLPALSALYHGLLALLIGAQASAEERQLGTLEWQVLMPVPMWQQWAVKTFVVVGLALLLGVAVPMVMSLAPVFGHSGTAVRAMWLPMTLAAALLSITGLYVSSLSTSGVRAMAFAIPVVAVAIVGVQFVAVVLRRMEPGAGPLSRSSLSVEWLFALLAAGMISLLLRLAYLNHRSVDRGSIASRCRPSASPRRWREPSWS
jgi:hypothetical protein